MSPDAELLVLRLAFIAVLLGFLWAVALTLRGSLRGRPQAVAREARLVVEAPGTPSVRAGTTFTLAGTMLIGRDSTAAVYLPDASVSGEHAEIAPQGRGWALRDLGSLNGTLLNDRPVTAVWTRMRVGDVVTAGVVRLRLEDG